MKSQIPPFFTILGPDFVARKVPLYRRFWEHACGPSDPGVGGGGGRDLNHYDQSSNCVIIRGALSLTPASYQAELGARNRWYLTTLKSL